MNQRTGHWTRGQAVIIRKLARVADDYIAAASVTVTESGRQDLENDRRFVRVLLLEAEQALGRVIRAEQRKVAGVGL
jgi:hypothetical protein